MTLSHVSEVLPSVLHARPKTLDDLAEVFEAQESYENPDVVSSMKALRMTSEETLSVPELGSFVFTDWSKQQCAALLGVRWDRWFSQANPHEQAEEINRRLWRNDRAVRLRTSRHTAGANGTHGVLRALVSPGYSPVADSRLARLLGSVLRGSDPELAVARWNVTDRTTSFVVGVGRPFHAGSSHEVGDVWGGLLIRNSGVGFASLVVSLHLTRLLCKNGMTAPLPDALVLRRAHRGVNDQVLTNVIAGRLTNLPIRFREAAELFGRAEARPVTDIRVEVTAILRSAAIPRRNLTPILEAWDHEPRHTAFAVSQAITRAAQTLSPELRFELEQAAGAYLAQGMSPEPSPPHVNREN